MKISKELKKKNTCSDRPRQAGSQEARQPAEDCLLAPALATFTAIAATNKRKVVDKFLAYKKKEERRKNFMRKALEPLSVFCTVSVTSVGSKKKKQKRLPLLNFALSCSSYSVKRFFFFKQKPQSLFSIFILDHSSNQFHSNKRLEITNHKKTNTYHQIIIQPPKLTTTPFH